MKYIQALNIDTTVIEHFFISNTVDTEEFIKSLNYIKSGWHHNWKRVARDVRKIENISKLSFEHRMKYIVTENENGIKEIFIFDKNINHDYMYEAIQGLNEELHKAISAGFTDGLSCYGRSETLNLDSNPDDFELTKSNKTLCS